ncbi:MAG: ester cyclase [Pyrinomonadaceae bacterium]
MDSKELLKVWIDAFESKSPERVNDCYAADAINFQIAAGEPAVGREQIAKHNAEFFCGFPDAWARVENLMGEADWAAWEWTGGGTFLGKFYGKMPTGRSFEIRGCGFFNFRDGKIVIQRGYWDKLSWFSQVGLAVE